MVIWDRDDYLKEADRQLVNNKSIGMYRDVKYRDVKYTKNILSLLVDKSNMIFQSLSKHKNISEKKIRYL